MRLLALPVFWTAALLAALGLRGLAAEERAVGELVAAIESERPVLVANARRSRELDPAAAHAMGRLRRRDDIWWLGWFDRGGARYDSRFGRPALKADLRCSDGWARAASTRSPAVVDVGFGVREVAVPLLDHGRVLGVVVAHHYRRPS